MSAFSRVCGGADALLRDVQGESSKSETSMKVFLIIITKGQLSASLTAVSDDDVILEIAMSSTFANRVLVRLRVCGGVVERRVQYGGLKEKVIRDAAARSAAMRVLVG